MEIHRYRPWGDPGRRDEWGRLLDWPWRVFNDVVGTHEWPSVEILERDHFVVVRAEIPGVDPQKMEVRVTQDTVTLKGELSEEADRGAQGYYHSERRYGSFLRTIALPAEVNGDQAKATYRHGLLEVVAPKMEDIHSEGRKLPIETH